MTSLYYCACSFPAEVGESDACTQPVRHGATDDTTAGANHCRNTCRCIAATHRLAWVRLRLCGRHAHVGEGEPADDRGDGSDEHDEHHRTNVHGLCDTTTSRAPSVMRGWPFTTRAGTTSSTCYSMQTTTKEKEREMQQQQ